MSICFSFHTNGVFTLPYTEVNTETDKKWNALNYVEVFGTDVNTDFL